MLCDSVKVRFGTREEGDMSSCLREGKSYGFTNSSTSRSISKYDTGSEYGVIRTYLRR